MEMMDEYGTKSVLHGWKEAMKHSRKLALSGISGWKQGSFYATDTLEDQPVGISVVVPGSSIIAGPLTATPEGKESRE